nr:hypothetical protein BCU58_04225 [Vibrio sp. 10N.286.48.B7]
MPSTDTLGLMLSVGEQCPFDEYSLKEKVIGEFTKARLTPTTARTDFLGVNISCIEAKNNLGNIQGYSIHSDIRFGLELDNGSLVLESHNRGGMMVGGDVKVSKAFYFNTIRDQISDALVTHLESYSYKSVAQKEDVIINLMALKTRDNAYGLTEDLKRRGYNAFVKDERTFYRVLIKVNKNDEAKAIVDELEQITGATGEIISL